MTFTSLRRQSCEHPFHEYSWLLIHLKSSRTVLAHGDYHGTTVKNGIVSGILGCIQARPFLTMTMRNMSGNAQVIGLTRPQPRAVQQGHIEERGESHRCGQLNDEGPYMTVRPGLRRRRVLPHTGYLCTLMNIAGSASRYSSMYTVLTICLKPRTYTLAIFSGTLIPLASRTLGPKVSAQSLVLVCLTDKIYSSRACFVLHHSNSMLREIFLLLICAAWVDFAVRFSPQIEVRSMSTRYSLSINIM